MQGRKSTQKATPKKPAEPEAVVGKEESRRKKAILDAVRSSSTPVKAILEEIGLNQSTYYRWLKYHKDKGLDGLETGSPVSDELWQRFTDLEKRQAAVVDENSLSIEETETVEETETMKNEKDKEKTIPKEPLKEIEKGTKPETERPAQPAGPEEEKGSSSPPSLHERIKERIVERIKGINMTFVYAGAAFILVMAILFCASKCNSNKFYLKQNNQMVELWQGRYAPMGSHLLASFSDLKILETAPKQDVYTKAQAFGIVSDYYIKQADNILKAEGTPDLTKVVSNLTRASDYAVSVSERKAIMIGVGGIDRLAARLNSLQYPALLGKIEIALSKGTVSNFAAAKEYLAEAIPMSSTDLQNVLKTKLAAVEDALANKGERKPADVYKEALNRQQQKTVGNVPEKSEED